MKKSSAIPVLYIITKLELGGAQKVCLTLQHNLKNHGLQTFLVSGAQGILVDQVKQDETVFLLSGFTREVSTRALIKEIKNFIELVRVIKKLKKEHPGLIVHTHSTKAGLLGRWASFFAGVKNRVHTIHGYGFHAHQNKISWFINVFLEYITSFITTHYVCVSSADVQTGIHYFPRFARKYSIIRAAVNWDQFSAANALKERAMLIQNKPFIFGTVACFKPQKNLLDLLHAFNAVYQQNALCRLHIIGDGYLRSTLEQWIQHYNLGNAVTLLGWQKNVEQHMAHWNAFTLTSLWEGLPCAIVEARLLKLPILAYDTGGIKDIINNGTNGYLYPQGNWQALAQGMLELSTNPELANALENADDNLDEFKDATMVQKHLALYKTLAEKN